MINRFELVSRHNPNLTKVDLESPLTVGNGEVAFTADVTGMQSLYEEHRQHHVPLCTMSQWGWHRTPAVGNVYYTMDDLAMTEYESMGRKVRYAVEKQPGNEAVYTWLRENPHRLNLGRIGLFWKEKEINSEDITQVHQELFLYEGRLHSQFLLHQMPVTVETFCHQEEDVLGFSIASPALADGRLTVKVRFPYGSPDITASDWEKEKEKEHQSEVIHETGQEMRLKRRLNEETYFVQITADTKAQLIKTGEHEITIRGEETLRFSVSLSLQEKATSFTVDQIRESSRKGFKKFWEEGAMVELHDSLDPRAEELERRIILSLYLLAIQSCGSMPPQETGLTCNSWYGKFHLEMYPWHCAFLPLWNRSHKMKKGLQWYKEHLPQARANAKRNGYLGARWPKMIANDAIDSPSVIATLLIWQQPHILYMLELYYQAERNEDILTQYWEVVKETAEFMCDFAVYNEATGCYDLPAPLIPAQEEHDPRTTKNPTFELEYWSFTLKLASQWAERLGKREKTWEQVSNHMAVLPVKDGRYLAHETCFTTFEKFNRDHPSMVGAFGLIPGDRVEPLLMSNTIAKVMECWDFSTMWGWDFALMAMTKVRLHDAPGALDVLLMDTPKNSYVASGNNFQRLRTDLPLYLPGNGSLLLAVAMMSAGYAGSEVTPGFPKDGSWNVTVEGMNPFPY